MSSAFALLLITIAGLVLRAWDLGAHGTWFDEAYHLALIREPSVGRMLDAVLANPPADPLYPLLLRAWAAVAGTGDAVLRLPSVVAGTLTIPAAAWLARELDGRRGVGLVAAAAVAISPYGLEFSREAAPYAIAALATTVALAAGWRWRRTGRGRDGVLAVAIAALAVHTHYVVPMILMLAWATGWFRWSGPRRPGARAWTLAASGVLAAFTPWLVALMLAWSGAATPRSSLPDGLDLSELGGALVQYAAGTATLLGGFRSLAVLGVAVATGLVWLGWREGGAHERRGLRMVVGIAALVFLVPALASAATGRWLFVAHFGLFLLPAISVAAAAGLVRMHERGVFGWGQRLVPGTAVIAWALVAGLGSGLFFLRPPHGADGLRELVRTLEAEVKPGEPVLVAPAILVPSLATYTDLRLSGIPAPFDLRDLYGPYAHPPAPEGVRAAVAGLARDRDAIWLVVREELPDTAPVIAALAAGRVVTLRFEAVFGTLLRFEAAP